MPSRWQVSAIFVFWLGAMSWLTVRELLPRYRSGEPPGFTIELTDEVNVGTGSATRAEWTVHFQGEAIGTCVSDVRRRDDSFELKSHYYFKNFELLRLHGQKIEIKKLQIQVSVTEEGHLLGTNIFIAGTPDLEATLEGHVVQHQMRSHAVAKIGGLEVFKTDFDPVEISGLGNIINPMHLQNRVRGLWVGRTWTVPMIDSFAIVFPGSQKTNLRLQAEVFADAMAWHDEANVPCYRIDHWQAGEEVSARVWVRRLDDLVLKQEALYGGKTITVERVYAK